MNQVLSSNKDLQKEETDPNADSELASISMSASGKTLREDEQISLPGGL